MPAKDASTMSIVTQTARTLRLRTAVHVINPASLNTPSPNVAPVYVTLWRVNRAGSIFAAPRTPRVVLINVRQPGRSEEHTSELQSRGHLVCRLLLEKKKQIICQLHHSRP